MLHSLWDSFQPSRLIHLAGQCESGSMKSPTTVSFATRKIEDPRPMLLQIQSLSVCSYMFNIERLLITSPKALGEVLTTNCYKFVRPKSIRIDLGRILGVGILTAEGDEHRVCVVQLDLTILTSICRCNASILCQLLATAILKIYIQYSGRNQGSLLRA